MFSLCVGVVCHVCVWPPGQLGFLFASHETSKLIKTWDHFNDVFIIIIYFLKWERGVASHTHTSFASVLMLPGQVSHIFIFQSKRLGRMSVCLLTHTHTHHPG